MINTTGRILELLAGHTGIELPPRQEARARRWAANLAKHSEAAARFRARNQPPEPERAAFIPTPIGRAHRGEQEAYRQRGRNPEVPRSIGIAEPPAVTPKAAAASDSIASPEDAAAYRRYGELAEKHPLEAAQYYSANADAVLRGRHDVVKARQRQVRAELSLTVHGGQHAHARIFSAR